MRYRPKPVFIVFGLLALAALAAIELQGSYFLKEFKARSLLLIRDKIGLDGEIGGVEGGIFGGVALKDVKLYGSLPSRAKKILFSSSAVELDYRLWDVALKKYDKIGRITFVSPKFYFFETEDRYLVPKVFEPAWKEIVISIKDGTFYNEQNVLIASEVNGNFSLSERGIESHRVTAAIFGQKFTGRGKIGFPIESSAVKMEGLMKGRGYALRAQLDGVPEKIFVHGSFDVLDKLNLNFAGNVEASEGLVAFSNFRVGPRFTLNGLLQTAKKGFNIDLFPEDASGNAAAMGEMSRVGISGDFSKFPYFALNINTNHLKALGLDLLSNCNISGRVNYDTAGKFASITGDFSTSGSLINYDPVREIKGACEFKDGAIKLTGVNYGDIVYVNGSLRTGDESDVDLHFKFKGTQLAGLTDLAMEKGIVSGLVFGDMNIRVRAGKELRIDGQFEFLDGNISVVHYNTAKVTLRGNSSTLEFVDSKVYTDGQVLAIEGKLDLRDLGTPRLFRNVVVKSDPNTIVWAGFNAMNAPVAEGYVTTTDVNEQFRVNLRTYESQQGGVQRPRQDNAMELEYKLGNPVSMKLKMKENEDFFGLEHKVKF